MGVFVVSGNKSAGPVKGSDHQSDIDGWLIRHGDTITRFVNENPNNPFAKILAFLAGIIFKDGAAEFPPLEIGEDLLKNAQRKLNPLHAPQAYFDSIGNPDKPGEAAQEIVTRYAGSNEKITLTLKKFIDDPETGFKGAIYLNKQDGHAFVIYGGMDMMNGMQTNDMATIAQAGLRKKVNQQCGPAQQLYTEALTMEGVKSVEVVGYSLGAMLANDMAARLSAKATNIADIGLPDVKNTDGKSMYTDAHFANIGKNVVVLKMPNDPYYALAGKVHAAQIISMPYISPQQVITAMGTSISNPATFNTHVLPHRPEAFVLASQMLQPTQVADNAPAQTLKHNN